MKPVLTLLLALVPAAAVAQETVTVFQLSGERQCIGGAGVPAEEAADLLRGQGVTVASAERRSLPVAFPDHCGAPTPTANVIRVSAADWAAFTTKNRDAGGYGIWVFDDSIQDIYMYDGTLQCGAGEEIPLEKMADALEARGVRVLAKRKGDDGLAHIAVCGASTGAINVFTIEREDLDAARGLGFKLLISRETAERVKRPVERRAVSEPAAAQPEAREEGAPVPLLW
jgi:hypothetical protein